MRIKFGLCFGVVCLLSLTLTVEAADVPWLKEVTTPPEQIAKQEKSLPPFLLQKDGSPITTVKEWEPVRESIRQKWLDFLGPLPTAPAQMPLNTIETEKLEHCTRSLVSYEAEPGRVVKAFLLRPLPTTDQPKPAVAVFHSTTKETINAVGGTGSKPVQAIGLRLAERGYVVLCPANYLWETKSYLKSVAAAKKRHPHSLGMATMLADGMRAVDILVSLPDVDAKRIGTIGHSLGAKEALYLTAFDDRIVAGVESEGGIGLTSTNWEAPWYLGPAIQEPDFPRGHSELLALIAPRPFLALGGESGRGSSDGDRSWPDLLVGQQVARLYGTPVRIGLFNHHEGHKLSPKVEEKAFTWLDTYVRDAQQ